MGSFLVAFNEYERGRLASFNRFYEARVRQLPNTLDAMLDSDTWREVMEEAKRVLIELAWSADA